jgi:light-regulated signal transduction histidine kinase (bacteriophytochrome)
VVTADDAQLQQLFRNLIGNALKYRREDPPQIRVWTERQTHAWRFCVQDNGIGIEPRFFERIFRIFQRLHPRDRYEGTGIGLAICKKIVERHGGTIWMESIPGQGSAFYFTIPDLKEDI